VRRLLLIALSFEVGFALLVVPWSVFWDRNYFAQALPPLHTVITNNFVRGAVSGIGLLNLVVGAAELISLMLARRAQPPVSALHAPRLYDE
jgi:hypothetical protein